MDGDCIACYLWKIITRDPGKGFRIMKKIIQKIFTVSFFVYVLAVVYIILFLGSRGSWGSMPFSEYVKLQSNFIPFKTITSYITDIRNGSMNMDIPIKNLLGNLILFLPAGLYIPFFLRKINSFKKCLLTGLIILLLIEAVQFLSRRGSFDIDDIILNICGIALGYGVWRLKFVQILLNRFCSSDKYGDRLLWTAK